MAGTRGIPPMATYSNVRRAACGPVWRRGNESWGIVIVVVDAGVERESGGYQVSGLIASAGGQLEHQRSGWDARGRDRGASVIRGPFECEHLRARGDADRGVVHRVVEVELERRTGIDLTAVSDRSGTRRNPRDPRIKGRVE